MLSVIITSHHDAATCYLTAFAVKSQLDRQEIPHEIIIVADGGTEIKYENQGMKCIRGTFGSPQASRTQGIQAAKFNDVLVLESHVIVNDIAKLVLEHQYRESALTFCSRRAEGPEMFDVYGCHVNWDGNLWYKNLIYKPPSDKPYAVAQFGHSCFMLDREWFLSSGGYTDMMTGWGGEEPFLCFKAWMLGRTCWMIPSVAHYHFLTAGAHASEILGGSTADNFKIMGYVIAGRDYAGITQAMRLERERICAGPFRGSIEDLRKFFISHSVVN